MTSTVKIPEGWIETTLGEIATFQQGFQISTDFQELEKKEGYVRFVRIVDYTNEGERPRYIRDPHRCFVNEDDLVMIRYGSQTAGKIVRGISGVIANNTFQVITGNNTNKNRLYRNLKQESVYNYLNRDQSSSTMPAITFSQVSKLQIFLPPLPEQKAIAGVLSAFDDKIELLRAENQTLEEIGQTLFKERFGKYKVLDELPDGWKWGELGEIGDQITERVKNEKERVVLSAVNSGNLVLSESYFSKQVFSEDIAKYIICNKGDFAYNPARINIGSIGRNFYWNGAVSPVYVVFRPKEKFGKYLEYIFKSERFNNHVEKYANGSVRQALNYDGFSRFELLIPNNDILEKFNENLEVFEKKIEENKKQIESLSKTRDQLLPKLMSGEVRVEF